MYKNYARSTRSKKPFVIAGIAVLAIACLIVGFELTNITHIFHSRPVSISGSAETKGETSTNSKSAQKSTTANAAQSGNTSQTGDNKSGSGSNTGAVALLAPSGDFVSNHHPNLGGDPAPNTLSSVCTTTPGATCRINFTKDGVTRSLEPETTDRGGSAYWNNWKLQDVKLTTGGWQVKATATLNGKTLSSDDAMQLVVSE